MTGVEVRKSATRSCQFPLRARFILNDVTGNGAGCDRERASQIHLSRAAAAGKITVLRADYDLLWPRRHSRPGIDAGAATGLDHVRPRLLKYVEISLANAVFACFL